MALTHDAEARTAPADIPQSPNDQPPVWAIVLFAFLCLPGFYVTLPIGGALWGFAQGKARRIGKLMTIVSAVVAVLAILAVIAASVETNQVTAGQNGSARTSGGTIASTSPSLQTPASPPPLVNTDDNGNPILADGTRSQLVSHPLNSGAAMAGKAPAADLISLTSCPNRDTSYDPNLHYYVYDVKVDGQVVSPEAVPPHGELFIRFIEFRNGLRQGPYDARFAWSETASSWGQYDPPGCVLTN